MMHLCFIRDQQMQELELSASTAELFTPLSQWEPARVEDGRLTLPEGWSSVYQEDSFSNHILLDREANYPLVAGKSQALLMIRHSGPDVINAEALLMKERFSVGRSRRNELCCRDGYLSSFHGIFSFDLEGVLWYEDESTNGTFINGRLVRGEKIRLHTGDQLDFPPQMRMVVDGCILHARYPQKHAQMKLPIFSASKDWGYVALYLRPTGKLYHLQLPTNTNTLEDFIAYATEQVDENAAGYLASSVVFREADTQTLISDDEVLAKILHNGTPVLLAI